MTENALILLSGGLDSAVSLYWALSQSWNASTIELEYHQRPSRERSACFDLRKHAGISDAHAIVVPLDFVREVTDLPEGALVNTSLSQAPQGYIPSRNLVFYSLCSYYAEILGIRYIVGGHNRGDSESFPDAGRFFFRRLNQVLELAMWSYSQTHTEILLPLIEYGKAEVLRLGYSLGVPFELTWSCYHDAERPCGDCESCTERRDAFAEVGFPDPLMASGTIPFSPG